MNTTGNQVHVAEYSSLPTCLDRSSVLVPDNSSLLDSHKVLSPYGNGGGNSAREHIAMLFNLGRKEKQNFKKVF